MSPVTRRAVERDRDATSTDPETSARFSIEVHAPIERAFDVFTIGIDSWWPRDHRVGGVEMASAVLEPRTGGRWYEVGVDGTTSDWGLVLVWDPPRHVAMSWHLDGDFRYDAHRGASSRVDVFFEAVDPTTTTVTLVHSGLDRHGESWIRLRDAISRGWPRDLRRFADASSLDTNVSEH